MKKTFLKILQKVLGLLAKLYLKKNKPLIIGITGSVGKTSCRMIISQTIKQLCEDKKTYTSSKNFNSELGIVFSIFEIEKYSPGILNLLNISIKILIKTITSQAKYDILVLEYGIDKPGDMDFLLNIVIPDISIFTKLDSIHLENFKSINDIGKEKFKLMKMTKKLVYLNFKDSYCLENNNKLKVKNKFYNSKKFEIRDFKLEKIDNEIISSFKTLDFNIKTNILGTENAPYISIGLDIISEYNLNGKLTKKSDITLKYNMQPGRFSIFEGINNSILIDSTYNAGPESMKKMIENTFKLRNDIFKKYKIGFILGDMRELGKDTDDFHKKINKLIKEADLIYTIGKEMKKNLKKENSFLSSKKAGLKLKQFLSNSNDKYILLFKGSQNTIFTEEALKQVLKNKTDISKLVRQDKYWIQKK